MSIIKEENLAKVVPVIETYVNGTSWYRIYADGWCGTRWILQKLI